MWPPDIFVYTSPPQKKNKLRHSQSNSSPSHKTPKKISSKKSPTKIGKSANLRRPNQPAWAAARIPEADADYPPEATTPAAPNPPVQTAPPVAPPAKHVTKATVPVVPVAMLGWSLERMDGGEVELLTLLTLTIEKGGAVYNEVFVLQLYYCKVFVCLLPFLFE